MLYVFHVVVKYALCMRTLFNVSQQCLGRVHFVLIFLLDCINNAVYIGGINFTSYLNFLCYSLNIKCVSRIIGYIFIYFYTFKVDYHKNLHFHH